MGNGLVKLIEVPAFFYVTEVPNHAELKPKILKAIESMGTHSVIDGEQSISNTDWHLHVDFPRPYWDIVKPVYMDHLETIRTCVGGNRTSVQNFWFQQYVKGDFHTWHVHSKVNYATVYYVDMPDEDCATTFRMHGTEMTVDVQEGQILTFLGSYWHCSRPNPHDYVKTIVAINGDIG